MGEAGVILARFEPSRETRTVSSRENDDDDEYAGGGGEEAFQGDNIDTRVLHPLSRILGKRERANDESSERDD